MSVRSDIKKIKKLFKTRLHVDGGGTVYQLENGKFMYKEKLYNSLEDLPKGKYLMIPEITDWFTKCKEHHEKILK